ncbi:MAG TPA: ParA family protein [Polyangiaceae bacterium]|jgi:chromosome partitioning protein|nr:ParA family protein [Polyangiaceae bacterium]
MKSLTVVSQKGGVGKTTLSLNLAFAFARTGMRVALIDADPQGAIGHSLQGVLDSPGLKRCLESGSLIDQALLPTRIDGFAIMPVGDVPPAEMPQFCDRLADGAFFRKLLLQLTSRFDLVMIDTPSGFNGATLGALRAADAALSPLQAEPVALRTLPQLLAAIASLREEGAKVELLGVVLCMLQQRNADSLAVAEEVWAKLPTDLVLETTIPRDVMVLAASSAGVPLGLMSRLRPPPIALVFDQLASELRPRLGLVDEREADEPIGLFA